MSQEVIQAFRGLLEEERKQTALLIEIRDLQAKQVEYQQTQLQLAMSSAQLVMETTMAPALRAWETWPELEDGACGQCGSPKVGTPDEPGDDTHEARVCSDCGHAWKVARLLQCGQCGSRTPANANCITCGAAPA